ncbi:MAG: signal peptidase I [Ilumatobacteraceae bacterium]
MLRRIGQAATALVVTTCTLAAIAVASGWLHPVVTRGVSMLPTYQTGDLVFVADPAGASTIGSIAAYRNPANDSIVLHRIVGGDATAGFELRGDNNESIDPYRPVLSDMIGGPVLTIPRVGTLLQQPGAVAPVLLGIGGLLTGLLVVTQPPASRRRARRRLRGLRTLGTTPSIRAASLAPPTQAIPVTAAPDTAPATAHRRTPSRATATRIALVLLVLALAAGVVAAFALPAQVVTPPPAPEQALSLSYGGPAAAGVTYPDGVAATGDPVFLRLVDHLDVVMRYDAADQRTVRGTASVWVELASTSGWSSREVLAQQDFDGATQSLAGTVTLAVLLSTIGALATETGVPSSSAKVTLGATVAEATLDGRSIDPITSTIELSLTSDSLTPLDAAGLVDSGNADGSKAALTTAAMTGSERRTATETGGIPRRWRQPLVMALLAGVALAALAWPTRTTSVVMPVGAIELSPQLTRIRMDDAAALDEIAAHEDVPLLAGPGWRAVLVEQRLYWDGDHEPRSTEAHVPA